MEVIAIAMGVVLLMMLFSNNRAEVAAHKGCLTFLIFLFFLGMVIRIVGFVYLGIALLVAFCVLMISAHLFLLKIRKAARQASRPRYYDGREEVDAEVMDEDLHENDVKDDACNSGDGKNSSRRAKVVDAEIVDESSVPKKFR